MLYLIHLVYYDNFRRFSCVYKRWLELRDQSGFRGEGVIKYEPFIHSPDKYLLRGVHMHGEPERN